MKIYCRNVTLVHRNVPYNHHNGVLNFVVNNVLCNSFTIFRNVHKPMGLLNQIFMINKEWHKYFNCRLRYDD